MIKINKITEKIILLLLLIFSISGYSQNGQGVVVTRFPVIESFRSTTKPATIDIPNDKTNSVQFTEKGLLLTPAEKSKFGAVGFSNIAFNSSNGLVVEFEYSMYDGTNAPADGISVFLYDADAQFEIGADGAGLGYSYIDKQLGLNGAYLGVGFDQYGNFKNRTNVVNGINPNKDPIFATDCRNQQITLRGAMSYENDSNGNLVGRRDKGYPVLYSQFVDALGYAPAPIKYAGAVLKDNIEGVGGDIKAYNGLGKLTNPFVLRPEGLSTEIEDENYRKATIALLPHKDGGMSISVEVQHGTEKSTVIDKYHYRTKFDYIDDHNASFSTRDSLIANVPKAFSIGFAASTGLEYQNNLVRDVKISIPYFPETTDVTRYHCTGPFKEKVIENVFEEDVFYNGSLVYIPVGGNTKEFIDYTSFLFEDNNGNILAGPISPDQSTLSYTDINSGTWVYAVDTGKIVFTANDNYAGKAEVYYSAKGFNEIKIKNQDPSITEGPFGQDIYRSRTSKISILAKDCYGGDVNSMLQSVGN